MHGEGTYTWPDGRRYVGQMENDLRSGFGVKYSSADDNIGRKQEY